MKRDFCALLRSSGVALLAALGLVLAQAQEMPSMLAQTSIGATSIPGLTYRNGIHIPDPEKGEDVSVLLRAQVSNVD